MSVFSHREFDNHQQVAFFNDKKSGLRAIIAVHNTNLGPALGGCRMWPYGPGITVRSNHVRFANGATIHLCLLYFL
jgi:leucine dehydrogenase